MRVARLGIRLTAFGGRGLVHEFEGSVAPVVGGDEGEGFEVRGEFGWGFVAYAVGDLCECFFWVADEEGLRVADT